jgi:hypothetical protein
VTTEVQDLYAWLEGEIRRMDRLADALRYQPGGPGAHYLSLVSQSDELRHVREHMREANSGLHAVAGVDDR